MNWINVKCWVCIKNILNSARYQCNTIDSTRHAGHVHFEMILLAGWRPEDLNLKVRTNPTNNSWRNGWTLRQPSPHLKVCERKPTNREISVSVRIHGATGNNTTSQTSKFTFHQHCSHIESITSNYIRIDSMPTTQRTCKKALHSLSGYRSEDTVLKFEHKSWFSNFPHNCWTLYQASPDLRWIFGFCRNTWSNNGELHRITDPPNSRIINADFRLIKSRQTTWTLNQWPPHIGLAGKLYISLQDADQKTQLWRWEQILNLKLIKQKLNSLRTITLPEGMWVEPTTGEFQFL